MMMTSIEDVLRDYHSNPQKGHGHVKAVSKVPTTRPITDEVSIFSELRATLIRSGQFELLHELLSAINARALELQEHSVASVTESLLLNSNWHRGKLDQCIEAIYRRNIRPSESIMFDAFSGYVFNTTGDYRRSTQCFLRVLGAGETKHSTYVTKTDFLSTAATWILWNTNETLEYGSYLKASGHARESFHSSYLNSRSRSMLLLAYGVLMLVHGNHRESSDYLYKAKSLAECSDQTWLPRIYSAISVLEFELGNHRASYEFLCRSLDLISSHFGPSGWMLRIVQSLVYHGRNVEAAGLLRDVRSEAERRQEAGYILWCRAYSKVLFREDTSGSEIFRDAAAVGMSRLCYYLVSKGLTA